MKRRRDAADASPEAPLPWLFAALFGAFLGISLLKFGNPPIMERWVTAPTNAYEFFLGSPWPITWAYGLLAVVAVLGALVAVRSSKSPQWLIALPLVWLLWQCLAAFWTVNPELSKPTLVHFLACVGCFYLGFFSLASVKRLDSFWPGVVVGLLIVIAIGWEQYFGGLDQTRRYFFLYIYPRLKEVPPEYLKKISSTRIFSTLFYPNALAGAMLLFLPAILEVVWELRKKFTAAARVFLVSVVGLGGLACLYWSGSKGGWLLMLLLGIIWALRLPFSPILKRAIIISALIVGLAGFFYKYSGFFQKGATSLGARFDYWSAAAKTIAADPLFGTGPGTFSAAYQRVKRPESEMARLAHNDYLQQGSDSGVAGLILYTAFIVGILVLARPHPRGTREGDAVQVAPELEPRVGPQLRFAIWLGVLGWALQSLLEFGLYIPGLAWPAFAFMGLLLRWQSFKIDKPPAAR
jgi:hypothetical protein